MFIRPCEGKITSYYGRRYHPIEKEWKGHHGIDIAKTGIVPILATASGTVSRVQPDKTFGTYGNAVTIKHAAGWESLYGHLSSYISSLNKQLSRGKSSAIWVILVVLQVNIYILSCTKAVGIKTIPTRSIHCFTMLTQMLRDCNNF